ncbi:MAG: complex I NDUFA9 subunit family protein [Gammaproteobacteria bacterium]|nr:complex I NDUFA9 subunit family protein [Gammaproteobacteria bacterium]
MEKKKVCILGGSGFVGRHLCAALARGRHRIRVLTRRRETVRDLLVFPTLELVETDVHLGSELGVHFQDCDVVVNLVGILNEGSSETEQFESAHAALATTVAEACRSSRVPRLLHMSALNATPDAPSKYLRSKAKGEDAAHRAAAAGLAVTSFQPSVIFGFDDSFFNRFAHLLTISPWFFPLACPDSRFAPVYVEDVVRAFLKSLDDKSSHGKRYQLCGPRTYTLLELVEYTARVAGIRRSVVELGEDLSKLQALALEQLPGKPFSYDNYLSLQVDSACDCNGLVKLGIAPTSIESIVPGYLGKENKTGRYENLRSSAGRT